jgi:hypothetical protein
MLRRELGTFSHYLNLQWSCLAGINQRATTTDESFSPSRLPIGGFENSTKNAPGSVERQHQNRPSHMTACM